MLRRLFLLAFTASSLGEASAFSCLPYTLSDAINDRREAVAIFDGTILEFSRLGSGCRIGGSSKNNKHYAEVTLRVDEPIKGSKQGDIFPAEYNVGGRYYYDADCNLNSDFPSYGSTSAVDITSPSHHLGRSDRYFLFETRGGVLRTQPPCFGYDKYEQPIEAAIDAGVYTQLSYLADGVPRWIGELSFHEIFAWKIDTLELQKQSIVSESRYADKHSRVVRELDALLSLRDKITLGHASDADQNGSEKPDD